MAMMPPARGLREGDEVGLLDRALARAHHDEPLSSCSGNCLHADQRGDLLALVHLQRFTIALPLPLRPTSGIS